MWRLIAPLQFGVFAEPAAPWEAPLPFRRPRSNAQALQPQTFQTSLTENPFSEPFYSITRTGLEKMLMPRTKYLSRIEEIPYNIQLLSEKSNQDEVSPAGK